MTGSRSVRAGVQGTYAVMHGGGYVMHAPLPCVPYGQACSYMGGGMGHDDMHALYPPPHYGQACPSPSLSVRAGVEKAEGVLVNSSLRVVGAYAT